MTVCSGIRVWMASLLFVCGGASADVPIHDGGDGMTCYFFASGSRLAWQQNGGDWVDAAGRMYGDVPFVSVQVPVVDGRQQVTWDVTSLARSWTQDTKPTAAFFLRAMPDAKAGTVNLNSRETAEPEAAPLLSIEWDDGTRSRLLATADTHISCPTHRSAGSGPVFQVSRQSKAVIAFPFEKPANREIRKALLILTTDKQYARSTEIGVFRPVFPWQRASPVENGLASRSVADRGIDQHPDVLIAERYDIGGNLPDAFQGGGRSEVVAADKANGFVPFDGGALKVTIERGKNVGLNTHLKFSEMRGGEPDEAYFRYYLRFGDNWDPQRAGGKMPGFSGTYSRAGWGGRRSDGTNGWSARGSFFTKSRSESPFSQFRAIGSYVYYGGMRQQYGDIWGWNLGPTGLLVKNRWYSVEQHVKLNTPGRADGELEAWIDGKLVFQKKDIDYREIPELRIESVWLNVYHGGTAKADEDLSLYMDNLVVARKYIGPTQTARR